MSKPRDDCSSWADNGAPKPPRPPLKMIDGDKKDRVGHRLTR
jgi:hypothetical protein